MSEVLVLSNPRRRRKHHARRHYRRNPIMGLNLSSALGQLKDGALGAVGGVVNDVAYGYAKGYLPGALQDGYGRIGAKLAFAVVVGLVANKVAPGKGRAIAVGAATVTLHELAKNVLNAQAPSLPLGAYEDNALLGLGYDSSASMVPGTGTGQYMGAYMKDGGRASAGLSGDMLPP